MNGADEFAKLFTTGQYGNFYIVSGSHARGNTFHIFILPKDEVAIGNGTNNEPLNDNRVEVYGYIYGRPGWDEVYGWKHKGPWVEDFYRLVEMKKAELAKVLTEKEKAAIREKEKKRLAELNLLSQYESCV